MKKIGLVLILAFAFAFANAQDNKTTTTTPTKATQVTSPAMSRTQLKLEELPKAIQEDLTKNWAGYTTKNAFKLDKSSVISYRVLLVKDTIQMALSYDGEGKFLESKTISRNSAASNRVGTGTVPKPNTVGIKKDSIKK